MTLWVERLSPDHATRLAMDAGGLDRGDAERVAEHAGGNPLFIIEITGMLHHEERTVAPLGFGEAGEPPARDRAGGGGRADRPVVPGRRASSFGVRRSSRGAGSTPRSSR